MPKRTHHIDQLIINSPLAEPAEHWSYDRTHRLFTREQGRRPAGYLIASSESKGFDDPGVFVELPLVNQVRPRVAAWREAGYPGVTGITRRLLEHWRDAEEREGRQFFFCQLEQEFRNQVFHAMDSVRMGKQKLALAGLKQQEFLPGKGKIMVSRSVKKVAEIQYITAKRFTDKIRRR